MSAVVVDTNVVSYYIKGDSRANLYDQHLEGKRLVISFQTLAELRVWPKRGGWGASRQAKFEKELERYETIYATAETCELYASARYSARVAGKPILPADAWVAAIALELEIPLVTHNPSDFAGVDGLEMVSET